MLNKAACMGKAEKGHAQLNYFGTPSRPPVIKVSKASCSYLSHILRLNFVWLINECSFAPGHLFIYCSPKAIRFNGDYGSRDQASCQSVREERWHRRARQKCSQSRRYS